MVGRARPGRIVNGHAIRNLAEAWATVAHDGQSRKGAGEPYIEHPRRVAELVQGWQRKTLAWLHDTIEDAEDPGAMSEALLLLFPSTIVAKLLMLSRLEHHGEKVEYQTWIARIAASGDQDVIAVKLADIEDNLSTVGDIPDGESLEARYLRAKATLLDAS